MRTRAEPEECPGDGSVDEEIDEAERESFPSSDPQSSWAGPGDVAPDESKGA
jgi:hypothetical protein